MLEVWTTSGTRKRVRGEGAFIFGRLVMAAGRAPPAAGWWRARRAPLQLRLRRAGRPEPDFRSEAAGWLEPGRWRRRCRLRSLWREWSEYPGASWPSGPAVRVPARAPG